MKLKNESLSVSLMISSVWGLRSPKPFSSSCSHSFWLVWFCNALHLLWEIREEEILFLEKCYQGSCRSYLPVFAEISHHSRISSSFSVFGIADVPRSSEWSLQGHQASVWALLLTADCHLSWPLLWTGVCALVPLQVGSLREKRVKVNSW